MSTGNTDENNGHAVQKSTMSRAEAFKASHWVMANWQKMHDMTIKDVADELTKHIGKTIQPHTLRGLLRDMGREWPGKRAARVSGGYSVPGRDKNRVLASNIIKLRRAVEHIANELGIRIPDQLAADHDLLVQICGGNPIPPQPDVLP